MHDISLCAVLIVLYCIVLYCIAAFLDLSSAAGPVLMQSPNNSIDRASKF